MKLIPGLYYVHSKMYVPIAHFISFSHSLIYSALVADLASD